MIKYLELTAPEESRFRQATILSIEVNEGDLVNIGDTLFKVRSGNNDIDLPATIQGRVTEMIATVGEQISLMTPLLLLETEVKRPSTNEHQTTEQNSPTLKQQQKPAKNKKTKKTSKRKPTKRQQQQLDLSGKHTEQVTNVNDTTQNTIEINVPDIGADTAKVIEILVNPGDHIAIDDAIITLESDKASMDVPSTHHGVIESIAVSIDQDVSEGSLILTLATDDTNTDIASQNSVSEPNVENQQPTEEIPKNTTIASSPATSPIQQKGSAHASPSVRRLAYELGVGLSNISGTGRKGRISKDDVKSFVKELLSDNSTISNSGSGIPPIPAVDFTKFGEVEVQPLNKIKRLTASNLHRSWLNVPHVTHNDESNITNLEDFRAQLNAEYAKRKKDVKLSPLAFIVKAVINALQTYPQFNSSLDASGDKLIYKKYYNIGIAVETPNGLVVPVIKNADTLSVADIAQEMAELAQKARDKKLTGADMSGGCFTISSLGGIGGTHFTPIVNAPEVAILGVSRTKIQPVWNGSEFEPGKLLPLSLSYDHRVIDGAEAARFTRHIATVLEDLRRLAI